MTIWNVTISLIFLFGLAPKFSYSGEIALTFDDAPTGDSELMSGVERTNALLDALKRSQIEDVIFFSVTNDLDKSKEDRLHRYVKAGYKLGNHSHSHKSANKESPVDFMVDVYRAHLLLAPFDGTLPIFRFPYLHYGKDETSLKSIQGGLQELGYKNGYVTVDNYDWYLNSALNNAKKAGKKIDYDGFESLYVKTIWDGIKFYDELALKVLGRSPKHVLLLHENDTSALFLPALVKHIKSQGWKIISPQEAYKDAIADRVPNTIFHKQGRIAALASEKGLDVSLLRHESENAGYIDALIEESGVFK